MLLLAVLLPVAVCVLLALGALLGAMGDAAGSRVVGYVAWAAGAVWLIDLAGLVVLLALRALLDGLQRDDRRFSEEHLSRGEQQPRDGRLPDE